MNYIYGYGTTTYGGVIIPTGTTATTTILPSGSRILTGLSYQTSARASQIKFSCGQNIFNWFDGTQIYGSPQHTFSIQCADEINLTGTGGVSDGRISYQLTYMQTPYLTATDSPYMEKSFFDNGVYKNFDPLKAQIGISLIFVMILFATWFGIRIYKKM